MISRSEDGKWRFTAETVAEIDALFEIIKSKPVLGEVISGHFRRSKTPDERSDRSHKRRVPRLQNNRLSGR